MTIFRSSELISYLYMAGLLLAFFPFLVPEAIFISFLSTGILFSAIYTIRKGSIKYGSLFTCFLILSLFFLFPSLFLSEEEYVLLPYAFFLLPFIYWISLYIALGRIELKQYQQIFKLGIIFGVISILIQIFISPNIFGLASESFYSDLYGTTTYRATGLMGSPQNVSLLLSAGLFLTYSQKIIINFIVKIAIIFCGASTLSTFFGIVLVFFFLSKLPTYLLLFSILLSTFAMGVILQLDFSNTPLEFLSFSEISSLDTRFVGWNDREESIAQLLFGHGPGTATQGMIDRGYTSINIYGTESYAFAIIHEFGLLFGIIIGISFLFAFLLRIIIYRLEEPFYGFYGVLLVILMSLLVTPNFSSLRIKIIFIPILLYSFVKPDKVTFTNFTKGISQGTKL